MEVGKTPILFVTSYEKPGYMIQEVYDLRNRTRVGDYIRFKNRRYKRGHDGEVRTVRGTIIKKYPHIFMLSNGETYSWKDYFLGR